MPTFPEEPPQGRSWRLPGVIVVVGVLLLLGAILLPGIQGAREAARRASCIGQLKAFGLAMHNYYDVYKCFPPAARIHAPCGGEASIAD